MEYKYVIILFYEIGKIDRVYRIKNKRDLRDYVSYFVETVTHIMVIDKGVFLHSDNDIVKRARNFDRIIDINAGR